MRTSIYRFLSLVISLALILSIICNPTSAEESKGWYIKRRGNQRPDFPTDAILLKQHNAFFIDESYPDERAEKRLYLTFDAGYENGNVEKILDILQKEKVVAAFFLLDNIILKRPDLVKRMESEGHLVCNHTKRHKDISKMSREEIREDLAELEKICADKTGVEMSRFFRFPEGKYSLYALNALNELGYKTVFWSFAYEDWDNNNQMKPSAALKKILDNTHNGAIVLLHPTSDTNATILSELISAWRNMGYSFGSLNDL